MCAWQFAKAIYLAERLGLTRFVSMQNHYNLIYREEEREMIPFCMSEGIGCIPWSPLARGFLAGNRSRDGGGATARARSDDLAQDLYYSEADFTVAETAVRVGRAYGASPTRIALAWLLRQPGVTAPIIGATQMEHLEEAVASVDLELSDEQCAALEAPYRPHPVLGLSVTLPARESASAPSEHVTEECRRPFQPGG